MTAAPNASVAIRFGAGTYQFCDQQSPVPVTVAGGGTGVLATISIDASCNPGTVRVPITFAGTVNRSQPAPSRLAGVLTSQDQLNALIANTAAASNGFYLISGFAPTQNAALAGGIIGHLGSGAVAKNWWERSHADAPGAVDVAGQSYVKTGSGAWAAACSTPQHGEVVMALATSTSLAGGVTTILTIEIPSAGLWRLEYTIRASIGANGTNGNGAMARVHDSSGAEVLGTRMTVGFTYGAAIQATGTMSKVVQTSGPTTYTLRAYGWVANLTSIMSDSRGETKMTYQRIG